MNEILIYDTGQYSGGLLSADPQYKPVAESRNNIALHFRHSLKKRICMILSFGHQGSEAVL
jgi:hypothetical protein